MVQFGSGEVFANGVRIGTLREVTVDRVRVDVAPGEPIMLRDSDGIVFSGTLSGAKPAGLWPSLGRDAKRAARSHLLFIQLWRRHLVAVLCAAGEQPAEAKRIARAEIPRSALWRRA